MPKKSYAIVHDGSKVLICTGGKRGEEPEERCGYHFPGGTDKGAAAASLHREILEETGFDLPTQEIEPFVVPKEPDMKDVKFYVLKVPSVDELVKRFTRPAIVNPKDEPFAAVQALTVDAALASGQFVQACWTDWFGKALAHAKAEHLLG